MLSLLFLSFSLGGASSARAACASGGGLDLHWQDYLVTDPLPNVTFPIARNFAGNVPINNDTATNNTLFFWAFEKSNGSLTAPAGASDEPWIIWLNGGPGASSMTGLMVENGPLLVTGDYSIVDNPWSWNKLADTFWIDQPAGVGYATSDPDYGNVLAEHALGFLTNLVEIFPSLAIRPLYLAGDYAGTYIPYITKALFSTPCPPVKLRKFAIGDGTLGDYYSYSGVPVIALIETYPQLIGYDPEVFEYFKEQYQLCGFDFTLEYPPTGPLFYGSAPSSSSGNLKAVKSAWKKVWSRTQNPPISKREQSDRVLAWKRDLPPNNGTINPTWGCSLVDELVDWALTNSFPWTLGGFDYYDIPDALNPEVPSDPSVFLNDNRTRLALHAPSKIWVNEDDDLLVGGNEFLSELATNASKNGVSLIFYSGNDDSLISHRSTEVVIQNTTFGGIQGFTRKPATAFTDDHGKFAGIVHQERNVTYALFNHAGHLVPQSVPEAAFVFLREFILGSNLTGYVDPKTGAVVGGEDPTFLAHDYLAGGDAIFYGAGTTASSTVAPTATIAAWDKFITTATVIATA
ncbi:alpha/beta-hydrolase, partial [Mycena metata]